MRVALHEKALGAPAGGQADERAARGCGHSQPLLDGGFPGSMAVRAHSAVRAQNGDTAKNAQTRIEGFFCQAFSFGHADNDGQ